MGTEKVIAVLLIIAIVFSVASIVINLSGSNFKPVNSVTYQPSPSITHGAESRNVNLVVEGNSR